MHLADGFLSGATLLATSAVSAGALAIGLRKTRFELQDRCVPQIGVMSAGVFAAQMVNFPILPGTSGHLMGGALAAIVLGPWAAVLAMTVVVIVQCLLFCDGGLAALGANALNMAVVGPLIGWLAYDGALRLAPGRRGHLVGAALAAWLSVVASAAFCAVELSASGIVPLSAALPIMAGVHAIIGVGEAMVTVGAVRFLLQVKPDMLYATGREPAAPFAPRPFVVSGLAAALFVAIFLSPLASAAPDGLGYVVERLGLEPSGPVAHVASPLSGYQVPWAMGPLGAKALAGAAGSIVVFGLAWMLMSWTRRARPAEKGA